MKFIKLFCFLMFITSCKARLKNPYKESDYILLKADSFNGRPDRSFFINKFNPDRKMQIGFLNGKMAYKCFLLNEKLEGEYKIYLNEKLIEIDSFKQGARYYSKHFGSIDTTSKIFKDGKILPSDSNDLLN